VKATLAWPRRSLITLAEIPALSAAGEAAPGPLGLGCRVVHLVVDDHARNGGGDGGVVEVDVDPPQLGELAAAHAGGGDQQPQGVQQEVAEGMGW
jgi:hypothetical protein